MFITNTAHMPATTLSKYFPVLQTGRTRTRVRVGCVIIRPERTLIWIGFSSGCQNTEPDQNHRTKQKKSELQPGTEEIEYTSCRFCSIKRIRGVIFF